jgi:hypothetical protein
MKNIYSITAALALSISSYAQTPEDALKLSYGSVTGTARNMAIGGTMIGLGGEITSAHLNPAGLGFFKNSELVFTPGFTFGNQHKADYRNITGSKGTKLSNFNLGTSGIILAGSTQSSNIKSAALSLSVTKTADYNSNFSYKGYNNVTRGAERYAEEIVKGGFNIGNAFSERFLSLGARLANYTYLVDTFKVGTGYEVIAMPEFANGVLQENNITTRGGAHDLAISAAVNKNDKLFIGGSLAMPIIGYNKTTSYSERDTSTNLANGFGFYSYDEKVSTSGIGINAKIGIIYRPVEKVRFGLTIQSPSVYTLTDASSGTMSVKLENIAGYYRNLANTATYSTKDVADGNETIESTYILSTPWRIGAGASFVFNEVQNVKKQKAFIAADVEYITYKSMRYSTSDPNIIDESFYKGTNNAIKNIYKNAFNFKVGGEIKFNTIMVRLGGAYMGNPNKDATILKQNNVRLSGGLGYRHKGIFIDATYVHQLQNNIDLPYRLADKPNTFANIKGRAGTIMVTVGTKF